MRVGELDPYATFSKGSVFQSDEVADAAINLERLEYKEEAPQLDQDWSSSLGLESGAAFRACSAAASSSNEPDWLKSGGFSDSPPNPLPHLKLLHPIHRALLNPVTMKFQIFFVMQVGEIQYP